MGRVRTTVVLTGLVLAVAASGALGAPETEATDESITAALAPTTDFDAVTVRIAVGHDRRAEWTISYRYGFDDPDARAAFERWNRSRRGPPGRFVDQLRTHAVPAAESRTGRSMSVGNATVRADQVTPTSGTITYRFTWTNFAGRSDGELVVGDAIAGYRLGPREALLIEWDDPYRRVRVAPDPDAARDGVVRWDGERLFASDRPVVALDGGGPVLPMWALALLGVVIALGAGWTGRDAIARVRTRAASGDATDGGADDGTDDLDLRTDEEVVLDALDRHGGRMKQQTLLDEVEWSRTKTSDVVTDMHEAGQIDRFRLGRENVITLPGELER